MQPGARENIGERPRPERLVEIQTQLVGTYQGDGGQKVVVFINCLESRELFAHLLMAVKYRHTFDIMRLIIGLSKAFSRQIGHLSSWGWLQQSTQKVCPFEQRTAGRRSYSSGTFSDWKASKQTSQEKWAFILINQKQGMFPCVVINFSLKSHFKLKSFKMNNLLLHA